VAQPTDESDATTLPDPELNPLLNPLLAAHMGRWAEVYFTNPPEKRGQAISELLRELRNNYPSEPVPVEPGDEQRIHHRVDVGVEDKTEEYRRERAATQDVLVATEEHPLSCQSCGHNNSSGQRFCGMCGMPLTISPESLPQAAEAAPHPAASWNDAELPFDGNPHQQEVASESVSVADGYYQTPQTASWPSPEGNLTEVNVRSEFRVEVAPARRSYRTYVGALLAILVVLLLYKTWRGNSAFLGSTTAPSGLPQAVPAQPGESRASAQPSLGQNSAPTPAPPTSPAPSENQPAESSHSNPAPDVRPTLRIVAVNATSSTLPAAQGGSEELATAQKYLNPSAGITRDTQEAARWLWKAVAKQNLTATLLLSDLYLRGDGVPKSCDQARLLLDAAARKGAAAAAERLRNLQSFGCQ
jgi:cytoskeletal protein RodZ